MNAQILQSEQDQISSAEANVDSIDALLRQSEEPMAPTETPDPTWHELLLPIWVKLKTSYQRMKVKTYAGTLASLGFIGLLPWPHQISCDVVCEPAVRRYIAAPFDAILLKSHANAGQHVQAGQVLASLDGGELRAKLAVKRAFFAQAGQRQMAALSVGDHSKAENERLEVEYLKREIELLESRQDRLEIRSPINGVVITGDLERVAGATLSVGDSLFEIAALDRLIAEVAVPENEITFVQQQMRVNVALDAAPGLAKKSEIANIHLRSEMRNNASVFIAESELDNQDKLLRPGMNGTATVHAGYQPLAWVLFHRPFAAARHWLGW